MGFTQAWDSETGQERLWRKLRSTCPKDLVLDPIPWDANMKFAARFIDRNTPPDSPLYGYFYSWGGGWFFPRVCKELQKLKRRFNTVVLCDAVSRTKWLPSWLPINFLSMTDIPKLVVPSNVDNVYWFRQQENRPAGHRIVSASSKTKIYPGRWMDVPHNVIDDHKDYHNLAIKVASGELP